MADTSKTWQAAVELEQRQNLNDLDDPGLYYAPLAVNAPDDDTNWFVAVYVPPGGVRPDGTFQEATNTATGAVYRRIYASNAWGSWGLNGGVGAAGPGVATGGADGDVLVKSGTTNFVTAWLSTTAFGRSLLALASTAALRTLIALPTSTTAGRLAYYTDGAGALADAPGLFYDAPNVRLGVGTATPASKIDIVTSGDDVFVSARQGGSTADVRIDQFGVTSIRSGGTSYTASVNINTGSTSSKGVVVRAQPSQTANLFELQNSSATALLTFTAGGALAIGGSASTNEMMALNHAAGKGSRFGPGANDGNAAVLISAASAVQNGLLIRAAASQTADLLSIQDNSGTALFTIQSAGTVSLGTADRTVVVGRTPGNVAGKFLALIAGGATSAGTDLVGGTLILSSGTSTGTGTSVIDFRTSPGAASGAADNAPTTKALLSGSGRFGLGTTSPTAQLDNTGDTYRQRTARTPASATAAGNTGDICWDANFIYVCVATNTWKRSAIATW